MSRANEALPLFQRALTIQESTLGMRHPDVVATLNNLAPTLSALNRPAEALAALQQSLRVHEADPPEDIPERTP
jgi:hypothetical protein